jgi:hypothetical protein
MTSEVAVSTDKQAMKFLAGIDSQLSTKKPREVIVVPYRALKFRLLVNPFVCSFLLFRVASFWLLS